MEIQTTSQDQTNNNNTDTTTTTTPSTDANQTENTSSISSLQEISTRMDSFLKELKTPDPQWQQCGSSSNATIWRKMDDELGIYRLKMVGTILVAPEIVSDVLFKHEFRMSWDTVLEEIREIETTNDGCVLLYISIATPPGVAYRDLVHIRGTKILPNDAGKVVLDISTTSDKLPEREGYIRAHTIFSGGLLEPTLVPNMKSKTLEAGCKYSMISQLDIKGSIPKMIINMVAAKSTVDWFDSLSKACELHAQGKLVPKQLPTQ